MTDIALLPAKRLAGMIRSGKIGCLELLEHYLDRVERYNPALNAIIVTDIPKARRRARAADRARAKGELWGPLHGVPMTVKEAFDVAGQPTTWGVPDYANHIASANALSVDRWLDAGVVLFGKTNVPIWLADAQSFNAIYGTTNSPWNLGMSPGGSSGGSTAALAAGLTGIEMGSDIASSVRTPAALCGLFGHKPTFGICPTNGHAVNDNVAALGYPGNRPACPQCGRRRPRPLDHGGTGRDRYHGLPPHAAGAQEEAPQRVQGRYRHRSPDGRRSSGRSASSSRSSQTSSPSRRPRSATRRAPTSTSTMSIGPSMCSCGRRHRYGLPQRNEPSSEPSRCAAGRYRHQAEPDDAWQHAVAPRLAHPQRAAANACAGRGTTISRTTTCCCARCSVPEHSRMTKRRPMSGP